MGECACERGECVPVNFVNFLKEVFTSSHPHSFRKFTQKFTQKFTPKASKNAGCRGIGHRGVNFVNFSKVHTVK